MTSEQQADQGTLAEPGDVRVYLVGYDNGVTEEVTGIDEVRKRAWSPDSRVEQAREAGPSIHYSEIR